MQTIDQVLAKINASIRAMSNRFRNIEPQKRPELASKIFDQVSRPMLDGFTPEAIDEIKQFAIKFVRTRSKQINDHIIDLEIELDEMPEPKPNSNSKEAKKYRAIQQQIARLKAGSYCPKLDPGFGRFRRFNTVLADEQAYYGTAANPTDISGRWFKIYDVWSIK